MQCLYVVLYVYRFESNEHVMSGASVRPRPSVDNTTVNFYTDAHRDAPPATQQPSGTRRGSFLFRSDSEETSAPHPMTTSASAARISSMVPNQLHETFVISCVCVFLNLQFKHLRDNYCTCRLSKSTYYMYYHCKLLASFVCTNKLSGACTQHESKFA